MLQKFEIQGVHMTIDDSLRKYVSKKIGGIDRYLSRHSRESAHAEVHLKTTKQKNDNHCLCEVTMHMPNETINITESAPNMYAAVDITSAKLKTSLKKYKDLHSNGKNRRHLQHQLLSKLSRQTPQTEL